MGNGGPATSLCDANKAVSTEIRDFISNVGDVKEESITDYLVWKWRELDARFHYLNVATFTRHEESSTSGADFELELWLVHRRFSLPLLFQAKKLIKPFDSYVNKLNHPSGTQGQITTLLNYARARKRLPFYAFYSIPDASTATMCAQPQASDGGVFMADAHAIKEFADGKHGRRVSKGALLEASNPFHCMFCCPLGLGGYFARYFSGISSEGVGIEEGELPIYVRMLLESRMPEMPAQEIRSVIDEHALRTYRAIGVYDLRRNDERG